MPVVRDFRNYSYLKARIDRCGRHLGLKAYSRLYVIENTIRVVIHSVLSVNINPKWWAVAVDQDIRNNAQRLRKRYAVRPLNASPGLHDIHLVFLRDLATILRTNSHLFLQAVPDTDEWVARLEAIEIPRNLVGHMNFPNAYDRNAIDNAYSKLPALIAALQSHNVPILIPR